MGNTKAFVLAGGRGTRLRPITYYLQKTMIPIGHTQAPLLEYIIRLFKFHDITNITFLIDYKAEQIQHYFGDGERFGVEIKYVRDRATLKGTGGSVINAYRQGVLDENDIALVYYGDILTNLNLKKFVEFHKKKKALATVALASGFEVRVGLADLGKDQKIRGFTEKPKLEKPVSIGLLALEGGIFENLQELIVQKTELDLMGDVIPRLVQLGSPVFGFVSDAFWYDVGSIAAYEKLDKDKIDEVLAFLFNKSA
jgi:mannose-1-phosphate guanylyltransferase